MSTGADCRFTEVEPGRWQYELQRWPYGDNPDYDTFGPFGSYAAARDHLNRNHANPGGSFTTIHPTGHVHEWGEGYANVKRGVSLQLDLPTLAEDATVEQAIEALASGALFKRARTWANYEDVRTTVCAACNKPKD